MNLCIVSLAIFFPTNAHSLIKSLAVLIVLPLLRKYPLPIPQNFSMRQKCGQFGGFKLFGMNLISLELYHSTVFLE